MIRFFLKGLLRDKHRSLLPVIVVALGVFLTVMVHTWVLGVMGDMIEYNAKYSNGHLKVATRAYFENTGQASSELALTGAGELLDSLRNGFPSVTWVPRIMFGGLIDIPDDSGETRGQGPAMGFGIDLLTPGSGEIERMNIGKSIVSGSLPDEPGEVLISDEFAKKNDVRVGDPVSVISSTMYGSMAIAGFTVAGTVRFGIGAIDRGAIVADITDVAAAFDMQDAAGEILGFVGPVYDDEEAMAVAAAFNGHEPAGGDFTPVMKALREQGDLSGMMDYVDSMIGIIVFVFVLAMSIVLWNAGLLGGLRRYGEMGMRLAIGESKAHVYKTLIYEAVIVGIIGSVVGTALGLALGYTIQYHGLDFSDLMQNASMMIPGVFRTKVTPLSYYIGFFPGLLATVIGAALAGIAIFRRQTSQLFKELSV